MKYLLLSLPLALMACVKPDCVVYVNGKPVYSECYSNNAFSEDGRNETVKGDDSTDDGDDSTDNGDDSNGGNSSNHSDDNGGDSNGGHSDDREHKLH